jgi:kynurenine formamidase
MSDPIVDTLIRDISNWGRWGTEDELGTLNFLTPAVRARGAELVREGRPISLALPLDRSGLQPPADVRLNPQHVMLQTGTDLRAGVQRNSIDGWGYADDMVTMALQAATHWDGLAHAFYEYKMYNDRDCTMVDVNGAAANAIGAVAPHLIGRAVVLDVASTLGVEHLGLAHRVTVAELEKTVDAQNVELRSGDILLIRTGNLGRARAGGGWDRYAYTDEPGLEWQTVPWLHEHEVAAVATDTWAVEVLPSDASIMLPVHASAIVHMGLTLGENFVLDELAAECARLGRYEVFLSATALPFPAAVGSPIHPVALF